MPAGAAAGSAVADAMSDLAAGGTVGPALAAALAVFDPGTADTYDLVEAAAAGAQLSAWVAACQATVLAELATRAELRPHPTGYRSVNPVTNTAVEIAGRCHLTTRQAENEVGHSLQLVEDFPDTHQTLAAGLIDQRRARVITDELGGQDPAIRARVEAAVLPYAPTLDAVALRKLVKRVLHELAPVEMAERHRLARDTRYVAVTPATDGMAFLEALLPAEDATALHTALKATAADARRADTATGAPARTADQRRADALADLGWAALAACANASGGPTTTGHPTAAPGAAAHPPAAPGATAHPTAPDRPTAAGHPTAAPGATAHPTAPDRPTTGGGHPTATLGATAHPTAPDGPTAAADHPTAAPGPTAAGHGAPASTSSSTGRARPRQRPIAVRVTIPFTTLIGLDDQPGDLDGYGPIPAATARELAAAGVWTWLRTEPGTGQLLEHGRTRSRPPVPLADLIVARDRTCRAPGCHQPAHTGDLDHVVPFAQGGTTSPGNLHALCTTHHLLKHHGGWSVTRHRDGTTRWRSPTGHRYTRRPERCHGSSWDNVTDTG